MTVRTCPAFALKCAFPHRIRLAFPLSLYVKGEVPAMDKIVMTLLLPRKKTKNVGYSYAVQIAVPKEMTSGMATSVTSVRLINKSGRRATALETMDSYHPEKWRAAGLSEQARFAADFNGNPKPWYSLIFSLSKNVYDYGGSGDKDTNNGQQWSEIENLDKEWQVEQEMRNRCEEVLAAEWNRRIAMWGEND